MRSHGSCGSHTLAEMLVAQLLWTNFWTRTATTQRPCGAVAVILCRHAPSGVLISMRVQRLAYAAPVGARHASTRHGWKQVSQLQTMTLTATAARQGTEQAAGLPEDGGSDAAAFFLDLGLQSLAGGNVRAALQRLGQCRQHLEASLALQPSSEHLCSQLGAVCGSQVRGHQNARHSPAAGCWQLVCSWPFSTCSQYRASAGASAIQGIRSSGCRQPTYLLQPGLAQS